LGYSLCPKPGAAIGLTSTIVRKKLTCSFGTPAASRTVFQRFIVMQSRKVPSSMICQGG